MPFGSEATRADEYKISFSFPRFGSPMPFGSEATRAQKERKNQSGF